MFVLWQRDAAHRLAAVEFEGITIKMERSLIFGAAVGKAIRHLDRLGLARVTAGLIPVAKALRYRRSSSVGVGDGKDLRLLAAFHSGGQQLDSAELSF